MKESESVKHDFKFNTFSDPELERMLTASKRFCADMVAGKKPRWLSLVGNSGTGKSHLAESIWRFFNEQGQWYVDERTGANLVRDGRFAFWPKVVKAMKNSDYGPVEDLQSLWFVVIDDIGADNDPSGNGRENLFQILQSRLRMPHRWTVLTSNLSLSQIDTKLDRRIASRMIRDGNEVIDVETTDYSLREL